MFGRQLSIREQLESTVADSASFDFALQQNVGSKAIDGERNATEATHVFVSDGANDDILVYNERGRKLGTIAGISQPGALAADAAENLYVVSANTIAILTKPYKEKSFVLRGSGDGVAVAPSGLVAVSTVVSRSGGPGSIAFYERGARTPCNMLAAFTQTYFVAFDAAGDLFIDGFDAKRRVVIGEIAGGCDAKHVRTLTVANAIGFPGDIAVDENDQIASAISMPTRLHLRAAKSRLARKPASDDHVHRLGPHRVHVRKPRSYVLGHRRRPRASKRIRIPGRRIRTSNARFQRTPKRNRRHAVVKP